MPKSLLSTFRSLEAHRKDELADISSPLLLAFAALDIAREECGMESLTAEHITACLEAAGVAAKKKSLSNALARANDRVSRRFGLNGETEYRLMTKGKREISKLLGGQQLTVIRVQGGAPRTARSRLGDVLSKLNGLVRICDPYYGVRTFESLDHIPVSCNVRFLTARTNEPSHKLAGPLKDFKKEHPNVEFRLAANPGELHDRYVISSGQILIVGHGLKDIGGKESFVIALDRELMPDLLKETTIAFDLRWKTAIPI